MYTYIVYYYSLIFQNKKGDLQKVSHQFGADELNKFATKEIAQQIEKCNKSKAKKKVFKLVQSYFEECERNGWHDFEMWCEDNIDNDIEKILVKKVANEVTHIGDWLFE